MTTQMRSTIQVGPGAKLRYDAELVPDHAGASRVWVARHPDLPGCMSHGVCTDEALANLAEAAELYLAALDAAGVDRAPQPLHPQAWSLESLASGDDRHSLR
jgi:predicted RNase H-like HicB family nuclease